MIGNYETAPRGTTEIHYDHPRNFKCPCGGEFNKPTYRQVKDKKDKIVVSYCPFCGRQMPSEVMI